MSAISGLNSTEGNQTVNTPYADAGSNQVSVDDFLQLMIAQLQNQDFTNPVDDTQYVTQLAQFATMQQMQDLAYYSQSNYVMSLVGKDVTVASLGVGGAVNTVTGQVEKVSLNNKEFSIHVGGKPYSLSQIMSIDQPDTIASSAIKKASDMPVILTSNTPTQVNVRWESPSEDATVSKKLKYQVYYSTDPDFNDVAGVKMGTLVGSVGAGEELNMSIKDLEPDTQYYINVLVGAPDGTQNVYKKLSVKTDAL